MTIRKQHQQDQNKASGHWYKQPVVWLGIIITLAIIAGCIWTIKVATSYTDHHVNDGQSSSILGVPMSAPDKETKHDSP